MKWCEKISTGLLSLIPPFDTDTSVYTHKRVRERDGGIHREGEENYIEGKGTRNEIEKKRTHF